MTSETTITSLPNWLKVEHPKLLLRLSSRTQENLKNYIDQLALLKETVSSLPMSTVVPEIYETQPDKLKKHFPDPTSALAHICESLLGRWAYQHAYKFKATLDGFEFGMAQANFVLAFSCARAMFEEMAHFHFYLTKIDSSHASLAKLAQQAEPQVRKGKPPSSELNKKFVMEQLGLVAKLAKALEGSDFDWNNLFRRSAEHSDAPQDVIAKLVKEHSGPRRLHINDCLDVLEKKSEMKAHAIYDLFSEMVHPNFGSNTLVILTRRRANDTFGEVVLSSNPKDEESAAWFFELAAEPLSQIFEMERSCTIRSQNMFRFYVDAASRLADGQ